MRAVPQTNAEIAQHLRDLRDFLIIAGYPEGHAIRYTHISRAIEKLAEPVPQLAAEGRLTEIPMVGKLIAQYIEEILRDGVSSKQLEFEAETPFTVVEMVRIPGLGPKTARRLWTELGISSLSALQDAVREGRTEGVLRPGLATAALEATL